MIASTKKKSNILIVGLEPFQEVSATKHRNGEKEGGRFSGGSKYRSSSSFSTALL